MGKNSKAAKRRGPRGQGTCFPNRGGWTARKTIQGIRVERWGKTQAEALQKLAQASPPGPRTTVAEYGERWLAGLEVAPKTKDSYTTSCRRYFAPTIGHLKVAALTPLQVEGLARALRASDLSVNTVLLALTHLHTMYEAAVREGLVSRNPVKLAKKPKSQPTEIDPFTPDELDRIITEATRHERTRIIALLASTGMRTGEAIPLLVSDFDARKRTLSITKGFLSRKHGVSDRPKSRNSVRTIELSPEAVEAVRLAIGKRKTGLIFPSKETPDLPKSHNAVRSPWMTMLGKLKIRSRNPHQLRHAWITHMIAAGWPAADVAEYVGDSVSTVFAHYVHPTGKSPGRGVSAMLKGSKRR